MTGYKWDVVFRIVPLNGAEVVYWVADQLTDLSAGGGYRSAQVSYDFVQNERIDINYALQPIVLGYRPTVMLDIVIATTDDQAFLSDLERCLADTRNYSVFLSMDGGVTERQVRLSGRSGPVPLSSKTVIGATFSLTLQSVTLIPFPPAMAVDPNVGAELVQNGGFEEWTDASNALGWDGAGANLQIDREATIKTGGAFSAKVTKLTSGANYAAFFQLATFMLNPGSWYRLRASARGGQTSTYPSGLALQLWNSSYPASTGSNPWALGFTKPNAGQSIGPGAGEWGFAGIVQQDISASAFSSIDVYFRGPKTPMGRDDAFNLRLHGIQNVNDVAYYDDLSLYGPVLRPGVATW